MFVSSALNCSKAMTESNEKSRFLFAVKSRDKNVLNLCKNEKNKIIDNLLKSNIYVNGYYEKNIQRIKITYLPKRFDIIIKNGTAYFYIKGE